MEHSTSAQGDGLGSLVNIVTDGVNLIDEVFVLRRKVALLASEVERLLQQAGYEEKRANEMMLERDIAARKADDMASENERLREDNEAMADRLDAYKYFCGILTEAQLTEWDFQRTDWTGGKGRAIRYRDTLEEIAEYQKDCTKQDCSDCEHYNACELAQIARKAMEGRDEES